MSCKSYWNTFILLHKAYPFIYSIRSGINPKRDIHFPHKKGMSLASEQGFQLATKGFPYFYKMFPEPMAFVKKSVLENSGKSAGKKRRDGEPFFFFFGIKMSILRYL